MSGDPIAYREYLEDEWQLFAADTLRQRESREATEGFDVSRVLDVGCGGGQDLIPFATTGKTCVGVDITHESGVWAARQFAAHHAQVKVRFATCAAEHLAFSSSSFDVVLCRVAIPYTNNRLALSEMARVLRPGGRLFLKTHTVHYYLRKFTDGIRRGSPLFSIHAVRVMLSGLVYHLTGWQPAGGLLLRESFQSEWLLKEELARVGMRIEGELADSNPLTRSYRVTKLHS